ncbi:uncharacterized protein BXZ73DRAFT_82235 [Epithele typhae]|uniref:uncharacterized protein n=1 Tax=Epithele typhae TaxID=378194 RepID=UPI0020072EF0|nr:uncharacterized protein BXZ73DRAFT_82235 [Epithele typhae]KAH9912700.1 hypothetical protein BXZ73DRAFT_82235 [Epithele typhae]
MPVAMSFEDMLQYPDFLRDMAYTGRTYWLGDSPTLPFSPHYHPVSTSITQAPILPYHPSISLRGLNVSMHSHEATDYVGNDVVITGALGLATSNTSTDNQLLNTCGGGISSHNIDVEIEDVHGYVADIADVRSHAVVGVEIAHNVDTDADIVDVCSHTHVGIKMVHARGHVDASPNIANVHGRATGSFKFALPIPGSHSASSSPPHYSDSISYSALESMYYSYPGFPPFPHLHAPTPVLPPTYLYDLTYTLPPCPVMDPQPTRQALAMAHMTATRAVPPYGGHARADVSAHDHDSDGDSIPGLYTPLVSDDESDDEYDMTLFK